MSNTSSESSAAAFTAPNVHDFRSLIRFLIDEMKPKGRLLTAFNIITVPIIVTGLVLIVMRFFGGIGAVSNVSQEVPWGLWKGLNVVTGVAFAAGAYTVTFMVYILKLKKYEPIVNSTVLMGFLSYCFYAGALVLDLGRPWNIINPIIGNEFGLSSVLFLVAWHFMIYMICEFVEFSPTVAAWLGWERLKKALHLLSTGAVILGITLSTLHQSGLGALFLMSPDKIHPLWYSSYIPVLFFVSSVFAGLSIVIIESSISRRVFAHRISSENQARHNDIILGLGKGAAGALFAYLFLKAIDFVHGQQWQLIYSPMGAWYLVEMGFVIMPMIMFMTGVKNKNVGLVQTAAVAAAIGILLNRLNISVIGFKWNAVNRYYPSWQEIVVTLTVISVQLWIYRWVVNRMPVMNASHDH